MKFLMVDQIIAWKANQSISGIKAVSFEEYCLRTPLGYEESLPESLLTQSFIHLAEWLVILSSDFQTIGFPEEIENIRFFSSLRPGQKMHLSLWASSCTNNEIMINGEGFVQKQPVAEIAGLKMRLLPLEDYCDPPDVRTLFSEIFKPLP